MDVEQKMQTHDNIIRVGVALIQHEDKILIGKRSKRCKYPGYWELPGGKSEKGETIQETIKRELREELDVDAAINKCELVLKWQYDHRIHELNVYSVTISGSLRIMGAHSELAWTSVDDMCDYDMLPSNVCIIQKLKKVKKQIV